jgi:DNA-binding IclR family transcriptional regulator
MTRPLTSVDNALQLLLGLQDGQPIRVTDAAKMLGVSRATAHRLLATLEARHFVEQDSVTRAYLVGAALVRNWLPDSVNVFAAAEPEMRALARTLGETTNLAVLRGTTVTIVGSVDGRRTKRSQTFIGTTFPAHFSAGGLALLADLPLEELRRRYSSDTLRKTAWRRTELLPESDTMLWKDLVAELELVRDRGFATNFKSRNRGVNAIACSLHLAPGSLPFALVMNAPSSQTGRRAMLSYSAPLRDAAAAARLRLMRALERTERTTR